MFLCLVGSKDWDIDENAQKTSVFLAPWVASQTDILADDWKIKGE